MGDPPMEGFEGGKGTGRARVYRLLGWVGVLLFLITAFTPMPNLVSRWLAIPSRLEPAEAIVVLGAGVEPDGILSDSSIRRALDGMVLHRKGLAPLLLFSGPGPGEGAAEAEVRAALARTLGISPEAILTESEARTTREEAIKSGSVLRERGIRRILLVTDPYQRLFEQAGFEVLAAPTDEISSGVSNPEGRLRLMRRALQELLARLYYRVGGYL